MPPDIIKVCGITNVNDAIFVAQNGATALGFIFFAGSPRHVRVEEAAIMSAVIPRNVLRVGVFVNETVENIRATVAAAKLDVVQLHGNETPGVCSELSDLRVWKAFRVGEGFSLSALASYPCEAYFLDAAAEDGSFGGSGHTFPWPIAREAKQHGRVIVAGGLDGDNVVEAIRKVNPFGVDASSQLERRAGLKDHEKVRAYLRAAREAKE